MKVYVDIEKEIIVKTDDENRSVYKGEENADSIKVYCNKAPANWYLTLGAKLANGRVITPRPFDGYIVDEVEDNTTYSVVNFTLSKANGFLVVNGRTEFNLWINYTNDSVPPQITKQKMLGTFVVNISNAVESGENIIILSDEEVQQVIFNFKTALETLQGTVANDNNIKTVNQLIARESLQVSDFFTVDADGLITMKPTSDNNNQYYLKFGVYTGNTRYVMALVDFRGIPVFSIHESDGKIYYNGWEILNKNDRTVLETLIQQTKNHLEQIIGDVETDLDNRKVEKTGDTMTGDLEFKDANVSFTENGYGMYNQSNGSAIGFNDEGAPTFVNAEGQRAIAVGTNTLVGNYNSYIFPDKDGNIMLEDDIKAELIKKLDTVVHQAFKAEMEAKHNEMIGEHNALASNLQAQINTIKQVLQSDDLNLDTFQEIVNVLKEAGADIEAIFNQLGAKANTTYVDEQNALDRSYTDSQVNKAISDFNTAMAGHKLEVQDQIDDYTTNIETYVDKSVGDIPAILDYLIEVA